ncbi:MAG: PAS domain-containing protein [Microcoleus sp. PH2017_10_PVI_O_A]|uniref:chemotaxis protein CheB n=1 Tax=unclassified Microcoleus TaxID=2642155 RepID=UPI001D4251A9|nr:MULTISPECIES: chemotaxis protein CheB [unclassified Microcoleus]TAE78832.1 MAG: response regulator [Oscillatoriales cyanobacterium]MCC3408647.1 PAS domain-containing protein [Microcoleus sp. PH2017_10_PVI_O_A]MCC3462734.1 PAS domain-containing protein [Microcoleus sp. PH2017_11_PCY_U_A]MCC3481203.1 PAS domain-containing protein [Microcoleus sp. PH2017_12_PCY_D_A]MCC3531642.1 PAS domain-containing protein [Microcoleus sp. PH2017_21_RUC_O_A]
MNLSNENTLAPIEPSALDLDPEAKIDAPFPVVGIAASAGGLEAFIQLLRHLPADTGMGFVLIQHLDPNRPSLLREILARSTPMPVHEVEEGMTVEPNHVYTIPPNTKLLLESGALKLLPREKIDGKYMPADAFFESLAVDRGNKAIGVVLSGADGDGALGLMAIKAAGGVTFAQCEETAKFDSMPSTAVATGDVDFILPPESMGRELANLSHHAFLAGPLPLVVAEELPEPGSALGTIFALLKSSAGVDFTQYKPATLNRRMQRRMLLYKMERLEDYAEYLLDHPAEVKALYEEILIHVTSFFRDLEVFIRLKEQVFPAITQNKSAEVPIRIWVGGCSTGEEVYSIAMCLLEYLGDRDLKLPIQIFATDISEPAIAQARSGFYLENQMLGVSPERRHRFFVPVEGGGYRISKPVRELCVFARQNLGIDPPFSNLDLISCRNVLIYLAEPLQKRVLSIFHYSLNPTGFLILGTSESTGKSSDLFTLADAPSKIYAKKLTANRVPLSFAASFSPLTQVDNPQRMNANFYHSFDLQRETDKLILSRCAPVGVVVNDQMEIVQLRGDTNPYLRLTPGTPTLNLFAMAVPGLSVDLRTAIYQAQTQNVTVRKERVRLQEGDGTNTVNFEVIPFQPVRAETKFILVLFEEASRGAIDLRTVNFDSLEPSDLEREIVRLRQQLATANQEKTMAQTHLQAVIEEQENLNQDLRVANEEIISSNEELQSINEELETAKEEIQATNEELITTVEELRNRNLDLQQVNNDVTNLLASINIPILMLANDLRIRSFTPMAQRLFNLISADVGRPFSDIRSNLEIPDLEPMILEVIDTLNTKEQEVQTQSGYWYALRIRPYRTSDNLIEGVVIVLIDIDALKRSAATIETARNYAETIVESVPTPLIVLDDDFRVNSANRALYETFQVSSSETTRADRFEWVSGQGNIPQLRGLLEDILVNNVEINNFEIEQVFERIGPKTLLINACKVKPEDSVSMILLSVEDITDRKQFETERSQLLQQEQSARQQAEIANRAKDEFLANLSHELRNPLTPILAWTQMLRLGNLKEAAANRALEVIERCARAQAQLIEDLLDISRITNGKLQLNTRAIDLRLVVQAAIDGVECSAQAKNIEIVSQLGSATVLGDIDRLQQVLWNILSNAIKFTLPGGRVEIELRAIEHYAEIRVTDTGKGMAPDLLPHIFDRFRQGDSSTTKVDQGLGLGLSIVYHLVELHGGTVEAESPGPGQGTTIIVRLPLRGSPQELTAPNPAESAALSEPLNDSSERVPSLENLQVLVVDDEADTRELLKVVLESYGAEVVTAESAAAAMAALTENPGRFDVLISDIGMPEENGYSLIRQVRALAAEAGGNIPAAALTAYAIERERERAIEAGFQTHIGKPVKPVQLGLMVANLAGRF